MKKKFWSSWPKKTADKTERKSNAILAMVLLENTMSFSWEAFKSHFEQQSGSVSDVGRTDVSVVFKVEGEEVALMIIDAPVPGQEIAGTAKYAYNWPNAVEDLKIHGAHIVIALTSGTADVVKRFKLHTKLIISLLGATNAIGVYIGEQSLLIPAKSYLAIAGKMTKDSLPLFLWIYFGYRRVDGKQNVYTYGLNAFDKQEIEILNSDKSFDDLQEIIYDAVHYVISENITFEDGQTFGRDAIEKHTISFSKGRFVPGNSFKLKF